MENQNSEPCGQYTENNAKSLLGREATLKELLQLRLSDIERDANAIRCLINTLPTKMDDRQDSLIRHALRMII